jgi:hypothetical protein
MQYRGGKKDTANRTRSLGVAYQNNSDSVIWMIRLLALKRITMIENCDSECQVDNIIWILKN